MASAPNALSFALLTRRRMALGDGWAWKAGEDFPVEVEPILFGGDARLYVPVPVDDALVFDDAAVRLLRGLRLLGEHLEEEEDRAVAMAALLDRFGERVRAVALFKGLGYYANTHYEIYRVRRRHTLRDLLEQDLRLESSAAQRKVAARFQPVYWFAEEVGRLQARQDVQAAEVEAAWSVAHSLLAVEREIALFIVGGEVIRGGAWLVEWVRGLDGVQAVVRAVLAFALRSEAAGSAFLLLEELVLAVKTLGHLLLALLTLVGTHDVVVEIIPALAKLEDLVFGYAAAELEARRAGAAALSGWVVDDDPVDEAFVRYLMAQQPEGHADAGL